MLPGGSRPGAREPNCDHAFNSSLPPRERVQIPNIVTALGGGSGPQLATGGDTCVGQTLTAGCTAIQLASFVDDKSEVYFVSQLMTMPMGMEHRATKVVFILPMNDLIMNHYQTLNIACV